MSKTPSSTQPAPSSGAAAEPSAHEAAKAVLEVLAPRNGIGFLWLDDALIVRARYGASAEAIEIGRPVTHKLLALVGIEEMIQALEKPGDAPVLVPNVMMMDVPGAPAFRLNIAVFSAEGDYPYLVLLVANIFRTGDEGALTRQVNARRALELESQMKSRLLERANKELMRANRDLEEFAYVISHDLQGPLRALRHVSEDIIAAGQEGRRESVLHSADDMRQQTLRMSGMLNGLLSYARVGRKSESIAEVDTRVLAEEIVASLTVPDGFAVVFEGHWPRLETLSIPLDIALRNLIENALKHHDRKEGCVTLGAEEGASHVVFSVADDGPGIAPEWHATVFQAFRKVTDRAHPDGSGIGLALVKKTVESVGGSISIASDPAQRRGTAFRVVWPKVVHL
jgi:signal transduction histidine kinase